MEDYNEVMNSEVLAKKAIEFVNEHKNSKQVFKVGVVEFAVQNNISNTLACDILKIALVLVGVIDGANKYMERRGK